jgi:hypothetical protein
MGEGFLMSNVTIYLMAVLGLLGLWLFHYMQVRAGRILAVDLFDRSMVRMYIYVTVGEGPVCEICANAHGRVFLSSRVGKKNFNPLDGTCNGKVHCQACLIGLYGGWLEAREIVARIEKASKKTIVRLSPEELRTLVRGQWKRSLSADTDRISVNMLAALCEEQHNAGIAIEGYWCVINQAKEPRHFPLVVPAYLRLLSVLVRVGREEEEVRQLIEQFERRFPSDQHASYSPSSDHRQMLEEVKALLWKRQSLQVSA